MHQGNLIRVTYDGAVLEPDGHFSAAALQSRLGAGEVLLIDIEPNRSRATHNHQFAFIKTAWDNLPEAMKDAPYAKTPDTLRKHALIMTGYAKSRMFALGCERRAVRMARHMRDMDEDEEIYSIVTTDGPVVYRVTAESQKERLMGRHRFQQSKQAILEWLADLIGVEPQELADRGRDETA